nr:putative reverse transcriptase domain-containing protein [Tanacetum cinerariifolium]
SGPSFDDWQWRFSTLPFPFRGLGFYSAGDVLNYAFLASRLQSDSLQTKLLRHFGRIGALEQEMRDLDVENKQMKERECKLHNAFDKFNHIKGESLNKYYLTFTLPINDMSIDNMQMEQFQVNTNFLNSLPPEWSKFVTDVKHVKDLHTTNFDQLHTYLEQHELHLNEVRLLRERNQDPLAFNNATSSGGNNGSGQARVVKCYNCQGKGHMARQCTQPKRLRNAAWYKDKAMLAEAQEDRQVNEEQLIFLVDPRVPDGQAVQTIIPNNDAFQTEDLNTYDSDGDDISNAKAVLMANISDYGSDVISEVPHSETYLNDMENQSVHAMRDFEYMGKASKEHNNELLTAELERYKERVKTFKQRLNIDLSSREKMINSYMDDMIKEKLALKEQVDSLEQNISNQIKEKEWITSAKVVPPKKTTSHSVKTQKPRLKVYNRKPRIVKNVGLSKKVVESKNANHSEPNHSWRSNALDIPSSSSLVMIVPVAAVPRAVDLADSLVSTSIDQDAPSTSIPSTQDQEHSLIISQGFEESPKTPHFHDDPLLESLHKD